MQTKKYKIVETKTFKLEKRNIIYYIYYNLKEPNIAKKKYNKINQQLYKLDNFPERCPRVFENNGNIRKLILDNYIVIYEINNDTRSNIYKTYFQF